MVYCFILALYIIVQMSALSQTVSEFDVGCMRDASSAGALNMKIILVHGVKILGIENILVLIYNFSYYGS